MAESSGVKGSLVWNYFAKTTDNKAKCNTDSFKNMITVANKKIQVPHPSTLSRMATTKAKDLLGQVCDNLAAVKPNLLSVSYTTDLWTSRAGDAFISLTSTFIDKNWELHNWTPFIR